MSLRRIRGLLRGGDIVPPQGLIQNPIVQNRLTRAFGMRERNPAPTLAPEIVPVVLVEDLTGLAEQRVPTIVDCMGSLDFTGNGLEFPAACVFNPVGSDRILELVYVAFSHVAAGKFSIAPQTGLPAGIQTATATAILDQRIAVYSQAGAGPRPVGQVWSSPGGILAGDCPWRNRALAGSVVFVPAEFVLLPNQRLDVWDENVNGFGDITFRWRERPLIA